MDKYSDQIVMAYRIACALWAILAVWKLVEAGRRFQAWWIEQNREQVVDGVTMCGRHAE